MMHPSSIHPDKELKELLSGNVLVETTPLTIYQDWERPTNQVPKDFLVIFLNGDIEGLSADTPFARGYIMLSLYCKLNDDGSVKSSRIQKILEQFDDIIDGATTENYHFAYEMQRFITPTTPNQSTGYSVTTLNLRWTTNKHFNS